MRVPKNIIQTGKYTSGGEFVEEKTNKPYQGYYYELNGSLYTGKEYSMDAIKIIKKQDQNQLYNSSNTALFSLVSGITSQQLSTPSINSISNSKRDTFPPTNQASGPPPLPLTTLTQFYAQKINVNPIIIKKVDEKSYISVQGNPLYKTTFTGTYNNISQTIDQAEKQMPGLKTFLSV
jgi:hypothetical protein